MRSEFVTIGKCADMPVNITLASCVVGNVRVCLYDAVSRVVDYHMIEVYLRNRWPDAVLTDAMNFWSQINVSQE